MAEYGDYSNMRRGPAAQTGTDVRNRSFGQSQGRTLPGFERIGADRRPEAESSPVAVVPEVSVPVRRDRLSVASEKAKTAGADEPEVVVSQDDSNRRVRVPSWEEELEGWSGSPGAVYRLHMAALARQFRDDMAEAVREEGKHLADRNELAASIEAECLDTIDLALAAYGSDANVEAIAGRAMAARSTALGEMSGPGAGLSAKINSGLSDGKLSSVRMPDGKLISMNASAAAAFRLEKASSAERSRGMAEMFKSYAAEHDPGFYAAMKSRGDLDRLAESGDFDFDKKGWREIGSVWKELQISQRERMLAEAIMIERLSPEQCREIGIDPAEARERRLFDYGDPEAELDVIYSHEREINGRRMPEPFIVGGGRQMGGPSL